MAERITQRDAKRLHAILLGGGAEGLLFGCEKVYYSCGVYGWNASYFFDAQNGRFWCCAYRNGQYIAKVPYEMECEACNKVKEYERKGHSYKQITAYSARIRNGIIKKVLTSTNKEV